jgi:DNA-binding winged helix-turn-helix (wHTH) protein
MAPFLQEKWAESADEEAYEASGVSTGWTSHSVVESEHPPDLTPVEFRFRRWRLLPRARLLLRDGRPVELGSRAFDLLHLLLSKQGSVVEKTAIVAFVWPSTIVEESNLRFQMASLRKALGADGALIKTIPGRGYILADDYPNTMVERPSPPHLVRETAEPRQWQVAGRS